MVEDYIHRIGRSGRAGQPGLATTYFTEDDAKHAYQLVKILTDAKQLIDPKLEEYSRQFGRKYSSKDKKNNWF